MNKHNTKIHSSRSDENKKTIMFRRNSILYGFFLYNYILMHTSLYQKALNFGLIRATTCDHIDRVTDNNEADAHKYYFDNNNENFALGFEFPFRVSFPSLTCYRLRHIIEFCF